MKINLRVPEWVTHWPLGVQIICLVSLAGDDGWALFGACVSILGIAMTCFRLGEMHGIDEMYKRAKEVVERGRKNSN